ncbi:MAG: TonB-dependent receptor [Rhodobacteraceae bacterium]|nr:TonB-dependent receptor [Paracoccaceae bacterium]
MSVAQGQSRIDESTGPLARTGGYSIFDLLAARKISERVHLRAAIFNVFDRRHAEWADIRGRAESDPTLDLYTRPGRSVTVGATLRLD